MNDSKSNDEQLGLEFAGGNQQGYDSFEREQKQAVEKLNQQYGVFLHEQVRVTLKGWNDEFEGKLLLDSLIWPEKRSDPVPLRIGKVTFDARDIESCTRMTKR